MTSRPIIMSGESVRAILDGRKTMFRRIIKPTAKQRREWNPDYSACPRARYMTGADGRHYIQFDHPRGGPYTGILSPFAVGDRLWVRETFMPAISRISVRYRADNDRSEWRGFWRSPIHMPRWTSRITLVVTGVRVERLNDISAEDVAAEGIPHVRGTAAARFQFAEIWERLHGPGSWAKNPYVIAVSFQRDGGGFHA